MAHISELEGAAGNEIQSHGNKGQSEVRWSPSVPSRTPSEVKVLRPE